MRGRKRKFNPDIPGHIDQAKIPAGLYFDRGRWVVFVDDGKLRKKTVATKHAMLSDLHAIAEDRKSNEVRGSLAWMLGLFHQSPDFTNLASGTRKNYELHRKQICAHKTKIGPMGELQIARLSLPVMQVICDRVGADHPTKANHWMRYLQRCFAWAMRRGHAKENPVKGVKKLKEKKKHTMPTSQAFAKALAHAKRCGSLPARTSGACPSYLWIVMELAYLCRMRGIEVIRLRDEHILPGGVHVIGAKGSDENVTKWDDRLTAAIVAALDRRIALRAKKRIPTPIKGGAIIVSDDGHPLKKSALETAWQNFITRAIKDGTIDQSERFSLHGLKHRGITDTKGNKAQKADAARHKTIAMTAVYNHELMEVETPKSSPILPAILPKQILDRL